MKVSIVVSSYNYEKYLEESIESAFAQTYRDIEVVIVDDGSTDGSPGIIRRYEGRAKIVWKPNGGQASAFNLALRHCTGDFVLFLDCDDALRADAVEKSVKAWRAGTSKVHFPLEVIVEDGTRTGALVPRAHLPEGDLKAQLLGEGMYVSPPNTGNLFSRVFLDRVMPMPEQEWAYGPDGYLVFLAPLYGSVGAVQEPLGYYRRHVRSVTNITSAGTQEVGDKLRSMAQSLLELRSLLSRETGNLGLAFQPGVVTDHWQCLNVRMALSRIAPELDPFGRAGRMRLASQLLSAAFRAPELRLRDRIGLAVWTVLVGGAPRSIAVVLTQFAFAPGERRGLIRRLSTGWSGSGNPSPV